ncbi:MAG TPA: hypothetical protein VF145_05910, partial [Chitinophagaceae bacterium]
GRKPKSEKLKMMWVNKARVAFRYLPFRYYISTSLMWSLQYLKETGFNLGGFVQGWKEIRRIPGREQRSPLSTATMEYLHKVRARLWY